MRLAVVPNSFPCLLPHVRTAPSAGHSLMPDHSQAPTVHASKFQLHISGQLVLCLQQSSVHDPTLPSPHFRLPALSSPYFQ